MLRQPDYEQLIRYARDCLVDREIMLVNLRRFHTEQPPAIKKVESTNEPFQRNGSKRRSLNIPPISSLFGRRPSQLDSSLPLVASPEEIQFNFIYPKFNEGQHVALCAVLLDEWVKELAALAQEHTVVQLANLLKWLYIDHDCIDFVLYFLYNILFIFLSIYYLLLQILVSFQIHTAGCSYSIHYWNQGELLCIDLAWKIHSSSIFFYLEEQKNNFSRCRNIAFTMKWGELMMIFIIFSSFMTTRLWKD